MCRLACFLCISSLNSDSSHRGDQPLNMFVFLENMHQRFCLTVLHLQLESPLPFLPIDPLAFLFRVRPLSRIACDYVFRPETSRPPPSRVPYSRVLHASYKSLGFKITCPPRVIPPIILTSYCLYASYCRMACSNAQFSEFKTFSLWGRLISASGYKDLIWIVCEEGFYTLSYSLFKTNYDNNKYTP